MASLEFTPDMEICLSKLVSELNATIIVISDSNSVFIDHIMKTRGLHHLVDKVFTNPATWNKDGKLLIEPYHYQVC